MNDYLPKWACEKLYKMGCVSEFRMYYGRLKDEPDHDLASLSKDQIKAIDCLWYDVGYNGGLILKRIGPYLLADGMNVFNQKKDMIFCIPAFHPWDFVGTSEQAIKNAEILWPDRWVETKFDGYWVNTKMEREFCIDSPNAVEYICSSLKEGE